MEIKYKNNFSGNNKSNSDNIKPKNDKNLSDFNIKIPKKISLYRNTKSIKAEKFRNKTGFDFVIKNPENNKESFINILNRNSTISSLLKLNIEKNILDAIYNNKNLLIRNMKQKDRHGDGLIPKFDFLSTFYNTNCHYRLRFELIEKIISIYLNNDAKIIMVNYIHLINALCQDIKYIIQSKNNFHSIYSTAIYNNLNYPFQNYNSFEEKHILSRNYKNFFSDSTSNLNSIKDFPKIEEFNIKDAINKINKISSELNDNFRKKISINELQLILQKKNIYLNEKQMTQLLKFLKIKEPNSFYLEEFFEKIKMNSNKLYKTITSQGKFKMNNLLKEKENDRYNRTINSEFFLNKNKKLFKLKTKSSDFNTNNINLFQNPNKSYNNNINKENKQKDEQRNNMYEEKLKNDEIVMSCIKKIQNKIYESQYGLDLISDYFDTLLSYDLFRLENVFSLEEFNKVLSYENFNFTEKEMNLLFSFIDSKKDGVIDRIEFIEAIKYIPYPISTLHSFILKNNLSLVELAYKMDIDLYLTPINEILETKLNFPQFQNKMKLINPDFNLEFSKTLFKTINGGENEVTIKKIFEVLNIKNDNSYKELYRDRNEISDRCIKSIFNNITYFELKDQLYKEDKSLSGRISLNIFIKTMKEILKNKINESDLFHFLRMNKLIDKENKVKYRDFILLIYTNRDNSEEIWYKCIETLMKFLKDECGRDVYIFIVKLNNVNNNLGMKQNIDEIKLYSFFKSRNNFVTFPYRLIKRFDYDEDGKITEDDLKNIIINYGDKNFFIDKKKSEEDIYKSKQNKLFNEVKKLFIYIRQFLPKLNLTLDKYFNYLDENKDNFIDKNEFIHQMIALPNFDNQKFNNEKIEMFFDYFDELKNGKIDFNIFTNKFNELDESIKFKKEDNKGETEIEKIILYEFANYYLANLNLNDNELFTLLDRDHDGIISKVDLKYFCIEILNINERELTFNKLLNLITSISANKEENLNLNDIQKIMKDIRNNDLSRYIKNLSNFCNETINTKKIDNDWIKDVIDIIGMHISHEFDNNIEDFYNSLNLTDYTNKGQGISFQNMMHFFETNYLLTESFHMTKDKYEVIFNYLSNNNKFITLNDLNKIFKNYDFYGWMHKYIRNFLVDNFPTSIDAFKFFYKVKTFKNETPTSNEKNKNRDYITRKEFVEGIINLFPNKFKINTITNYYDKIIKKKDLQTETQTTIEEEEKNFIKFTEFNRIYFNNDEEENTKETDIKNKTGRLVKRSSFTSLLKIPFKFKLKPKLQTIYDLDPLNKIKKLIKSSKVDFKREFHNLMNKTDGKANIYQIKNMIRNLGLGLTNIEIEDIMYKSGILNDGHINLIDFYHFITSENKTSLIYKKNIIEAMKDFKQLIIKYYTNPKLAFEFNDIYNKKLMEFETFKKIVIDVYKRENRSCPPPPYSLLKSMYDFIDIRKDNIIDINEWNKTFCEFEGKLDYEIDKSNGLKKWEATNNLMEIYKLIARNHKIIQEKIKEHSITGDCTIIHIDNLINALKEALPKVYLSHTQWRMIASLGEEISLGLINYNSFIKVIKQISRISKSQMKI